MQHLFVRVFACAHKHFISSALLDAWCCCAGGPSHFQEPFHCLNGPSLLAELYNPPHMFACEPPPVTHTHTCTLTHNPPFYVMVKVFQLDLRGLGSGESWNCPSKTSAHGFIYSLFTPPPHPCTCFHLLVSHPTLHLLFSPRGSKAWAFQTSPAVGSIGKKTGLSYWFASWSRFCRSPQCKSCLCLNETT